MWTQRLSSSAVGGILVLVDHVLVDRQVHQLMNFGVEPSLAERREILAGVAIEEEFVAHQRMRDVGPQLAIRHPVFRHATSAAWVP